jgi:hypothetical protein
MIRQADLTAALHNWSLDPSHPRLGIYRNNVAAALINALKVRFPVTARQLGEAGFAAVAGVYANSNRPGSPVLIDYGQSFPDHVAACEAIPDRDQLADLARLESLWWQAYHAADVEPATPAELAAIPAEHWGDARFAFLPSMGLLASHHPVGSLWQGTASAAGPQNILVARPDAEVLVRLIDDAGFGLLSHLAQGLRLGEAVEAIADQHPDFDLATALQGLISYRIIRGVST